MARSVRIGMEGSVEMREMMGRRRARRRARRERKRGTNHTAWV